MRKYQSAESYIRKLVARGSLKPGDKVPSIRKLSRQLAVSHITVQHAYEILSAAGLITARSRSGYYVPEHGGIDATRSPKVAQPVSVADVTYAMLSQWHKQEFGGFGGINPHPDIFRTEEAHRFLRLTSRRAAVSRAHANRQEGNERLRMQIAEKLAVRGVDVKSEDVVITNTGLQGFDLCLDLLTERGDTVLLDTPTYLPIVLSLQRRGLRVLEIYSRPTNGIDPDQLSYLLTNFRVKAAILSPLNHFPTGVSSNADTIAKLARIIDAHAIPTLEFDLFSELSYKERIRQPLMAHTTSQEVFLFGNFLDVLGPNFNLGWVVGRGRSHQLMERKFLNNLVLGDELLQSTLAEYIASGQHEKNIRRLRRSLAARAEKGVRLLSQILPPSFSFSRPAGGYMCWVRGASGFDAIRTSTAALDVKLSLAPGPMFSPSDGFHNFFGVNLSAPWMERGHTQLQGLIELFRTSGRHR
jgi:DNA-binding transcriptional MocR family regulator